MRVSQGLTARARKWWTIAACTVLVGVLGASVVEGSDYDHKATGLGHEAAGYLKAPPPVYRDDDDAACGTAGPDLLLCLFPDVVWQIPEYKKGEDVIVWVNKVGPYYNPHESYPYYKLPFCVPEQAEKAKQKKRANLGELLAGYELRNSGISIKYLEPSTPGESLCSVVLDEDKAEQFRSAVKQQYLANFYVDDLPIYAAVGTIKRNDPGQEEPQIFVKHKFTIQYNIDRIIRVHYEPRDEQPIKAGTTLDFTYEVDWQPTGTSFDERFKSYLDADFFEHKIHWFSIVNSFMMVILLVGFVALILIRTLKNDFAKYSPDDEDIELDNSLGDDSGWKQVRGDVFRAPEHLIMFSALFGTGCQLAVMVLIVILFAMAGPLHGDVYEERGEIVTTFIACYALTSFVSGYTSGSYYRQFFTTPRAEQASQWQKTMLLSVILMPSVLFPVMFLLNLVAGHYNTVTAVPLKAMVNMVLIWMFVSFPLGVAGSIFGRHWGGKANFPCRVNSIPRQIPEAAWYANPTLVVMVAGLLPFGSIFIEMYFILTSLWGYMYYYVFGFMLLVFVIMVVVVVCTAIVAVYTVLNAENYHWQWVAFLSAGSTAIYVFLYAVYYFGFHTQQKGFLQVSFYFGYMGLFCAALAAMCGSIGVLGSTVFVKQIYRNIKVD